MKQFQLALRLLKRDARSGELTILLLALIIAVTSSTAISLFADRLQRTMATQAGEFLAADLVIASPTVIGAGWQNKAEHLGLTTAHTSEFSSVLIENDAMLLAGIKAVSSNYPLRGYLKATQSGYDSEKKHFKGPKKGEAWVEKRILSALKLKLGDQLTVGEKALKVSRIITYEPDKRGDLYSFSPRVMISSNDLEATRVIQPGSHVHYFFQYRGAAEALASFSRWAKPHLNPSQRIMDIHEDRPELGTALNKAERYLGLSSIIVVLISGVAIAMATRRYTERHFDTSAILRCLGCQQAQILRLYAYQFLILGTFASLLGCLFGWIAQQALFHLLRTLLPQQIATPGITAILFGFITGMTILIGFALPPLLRLRMVSPLRVLRRELAPLPSSAWFVYGLAMTVIALLIWQYTQDLQMTSAILGGGFVCVMLLGLLIYGLLISCRPWIPRCSLYWRFGLQGLFRQRQATISQILAFSITLVAMLLSFTVRTDLLDNWQQQLPKDAPNHFALNVFPSQLDGFKQQLAQQQINGSQFFPIVRGRLVGINGVPVQKIVSKESQGERATHRDLSLTWTKTIPSENKLITGEWWQGEKPGLVSIEQKLAKSLQVDLGDELTFTVGAQQFSANVANIRKVQWDTMKPNFYMIFSPGTLDQFANTYITSFYLPEAKKSLLGSLVKNFPSITILEVDAILKQFKIILTQLTQAINYLLYFALLAGFTVLFAALQSTLDSRIYEGALMRTLGANRGLLRAAHLIEFSLLGFVSGIFAMIMAEAIIYILYTQVLHMTYSPNGLLWAVIPLGSAVFVGVAGFFGVRQVLNESPMVVIRKL